MTHREFCYGFVGLAVLWQLVFVLIARDPSRYRPIMPITVLEKFVHKVPVLVLYFRGEIHPKIVLSSLMDPVFGILFILAYVRTRSTD